MFFFSASSRFFLFQQWHYCCKLWCFGGCCSVNIWTLVYGAHLHLRHQQFLAITLRLLLHYYLHRISVQLRGLVFLTNGYHLPLVILNTRPESVYICQGHSLMLPPLLLFRFDSRCPRIGSSELNPVSCMSNLMFNYLAPKIMIIHWNWDVIVRQHLSLKLWLKESRNDGGNSKLMKTSTTKTWYLGRVYRLRCKSANRLVAYRQTISLLMWK